LKACLHHMHAFQSDLICGEDLRCCSIKLCLVPSGMTPIIEQESAAMGVAVARPGHGFDGLLLAGTEKTLSGLAQKLKRGGDKTAESGELILELLRKTRRRPRGALQLGRYSLPLGKRTLIMGILNVTPDSFSDGGKFNRLPAAVERAYQMAEEGADIIDIGGESTRPGYRKISEEEELARVMPVIEALKSDPGFPAPLSIDTCKAAVAQEALQAGVEMVNDIWGLKADPRLGEVTASFGVPICLMHNRNSTDYRDLVPEVIFELQDSIDLARAAGISDDRIIIDPGIGFGKTLEQNLAVMHRLADFRGLGYPLLLGTSRKSMIGKTLNLPSEERLEGTAATVAYGIAAGAHIVRVHDVKEIRRVVLMTDAIVRRAEDQAEDQIGGQ
jgi:dihydropteroate synthase